MKFFSILSSLALGQVSARQDAYEQTREMLCRVNMYREENGMPPVHIDERLMESANRHSEDQAYHGRMSHRGTRGSDFDQRARNAGYFGSGGAENVAWGQRDVYDVMDTWIHSPGHEANILSRNRCFGYGEVDHYWTQVYGSGDDCSDDYLPDCRDFY